MEAKNNAINNLVSLFLIAYQRRRLCNTKIMLVEVILFNP